MKKVYKLKTCTLLPHHFISLIKFLLRAKLKLKNQFTHIGSLMSEIKWWRKQCASFQFTSFLKMSNEIFYSLALFFRVNAQYLMFKILSRATLFIFTENNTTWELLNFYYLRGCWFGPFYWIKFLFTITIQNEKSFSKI